MNRAIGASDLDGIDLNPVVRQWPGYTADCEAAINLARALTAIAAVARATGAVPRNRYEAGAWPSTAGMRRDARNLGWKIVDFHGYNARERAMQCLGEAQPGQGRAVGLVVYQTNAPPGRSGLTAVIPAPAENGAEYERILVYTGTSIFEGRYRGEGPHSRSDLDKASRWLS